MENNSQAAYALRDYGVIWEDGPDCVFDKIIDSKMMARGMGPAAVVNVCRFPVAASL